MADSSRSRRSATADTASPTAQGSASLMPQARRQSDGCSSTAGCTSSTSPAAPTAVDSARTTTRWRWRRRCRQPSPLFTSAKEQVVAQGDLLLMLEAMKMEMPIRAPRDGRVKTIACQRGELVQPGIALVELE